jgi:hypothetical protein
MTKDKFIEQLDEAFSTANKLRAVKLLLDTRAVGGLKDSKEFIDEYWYSVKYSAGHNVWGALTKEQQKIVEDYDNSN